MSELKSVNIASWGLVILALFLFAIGLEEAMYISEDLLKFLYVPGILFLILGSVSFLIALLAYWNGDKDHGTFFLWISVIAPIMSLLVGFDGAPFGLPIAIFATTRGVTYAIILALFSFLLAAWAFFKKEKNIPLTILFAVVALFVFFEGLTNNFIHVEQGEPIPFIVDIPTFYFASEDPFKALKLIAGIFAIVAAGVAFYFGFVKSEFLEKKAESDEAKPIMNFDITAIGTAIVAFVLVLSAVNGILYAKEGFDYQIMPGYFMLLAGLTLFFVSLLAYWRGNKESGMVFIWLSIFVVLLAFISGMDNSFIDQYVGQTEGGMPFFVIERGVSLGIVFGIFSVLLAVWAYKNEKVGKHMAVFLVLVGLIAALVGISTNCFEYRTIELGDIITLRIVTALGDGFVPLRVAAGIIALVAAILAIYSVVKTEILTEASESGPTDLKSFDVTAIGLFVIAMGLLLAGMGNLYMIDGLQSIQYYFLPSKAMYLFLLSLVVVFLLYAYWNGNKVMTVFTIVIALFCLGMFATSRGDSYGVIPAIALLLFMAAAAVWMFKHSSCPILMAVFFGINALAILLYIIASVAFDKGDVTNTTLQGVGSLFIALAGLVLTYIAFAKLEVVKVPTV